MTAYNGHLSLKYKFIPEYVMRFNRPCAFEKLKLHFLILFRYQSIMKAYKFNVFTLG